MTIQLLPDHAWITERVSGSSVFEHRGDESFASEQTNPDPALTSIKEFTARQRYLLPEGTLPAAEGANVTIYIEADPFFGALKYVRSNVRAPIVKLVKGLNDDPTAFHARDIACVEIKTRTIGQASFAPISYLDPVISRSLESQRKLLKQLESDWDGYGAEPIPHERIDAFVDELRLALADYSGPLPEIVPGADGSLQAEWRWKDLELFYGIDSEEERHFYLQVAAAGVQVSVGLAASADFAAALRAYFRGENEDGAYFATGQSGLLV